MKYKLLSLILLIPLFTVAQEEGKKDVPIPINEIRTTKIQALLDIVKENRSIYYKKDEVRIKDFLLSSLNLKLLYKKITPMNKKTEFKSLIIIRGALK